MRRVIPKIGENALVAGSGNYCKQGRGVRTVIIIGFHFDAHTIILKGVERQYLALVTDPRKLMASVRHPKKPWSYSLR